MAGEDFTFLDGLIQGPAGPAGPAGAGVNMPDDPADDGKFAAALSGDLVFIDAATATGRLNQFSSSLKGLVPSSGGGTVYYLRADGAWAEPPQFDVDIRNFGATSGSDSTTAVAAAISSLGSQGGKVLVPRGIFDVSAELGLTGNIELVGGRGSVLRKVGTNFNVLRLTNSGNKVSGIEINGNNQAQGSLILCTGSDNEITSCYLHDNGVMSDGAYTNQSHGVAFDGQSTTCVRNVVEKCRIFACHDIGISQHTAPDNRIANNEIIGSGLEGVTIDVASHRARVVNNLISGCCINGGVGGVGIDDSDLWLVAFNIIQATQSSLSGIKTQNNVGPSNYGLIYGNVLLDNGGWGIWFFAGTSGNASNHAVTGNVIRGNTSGSFKLDAGCNNNLVTGNSINAVAISNSGTGNTLTANA